MGFLLQRNLWFLWKIDSCCDGFLLQRICWFLFFRVDRVNSEYWSSHPSPTDSRLSLGIWYRTHRGRHRGEYDSTELYWTRPIFWTLRREVDHNELVSGAKPPAKAPYRMSSPELEELQKQACSKVVSSVGQGFYTLEYRFRQFGKTEVPKASFSSLNRNKKTFILFKW